MARQSAAADQRLRICGACAGSVALVGRTADYRSAVLLAANLGQDADTTAAITGQLAGALGGISSIPHAWLAKLAWKARLEAAAEALLQS